MTLSTLDQITHIASSGRHRVLPGAGGQEFSHIMRVAAEGRAEEFIKSAKAEAWDKLRDWAYGQPSYLLEQMDALLSPSIDTDPIDTKR